MYEVKTEMFSGPLEKLLEFIEEKKLNITQISLAEVTGDFLKYVESLKEAAEKAENYDGESQKTSLLRLLADFLVIAAQLILIKSRALLPELSLSKEEEEGINDLERRLQIYSELKPMIATMKKTWVESGQSYSRTMLTSIAPVFYPPKSITKGHLKNALDGLLNALGSFFLEKETIKKQLFTLEDKIAEVTAKITQGISKFSEIITKKAKDEIVVLFLALLHLLRERTFSVTQSKLFGDIRIEKTNMN